MILVEPSDIGERMKVQFTGDDLAQCELLISDAVEIVQDEFERLGRDFDVVVAASPWVGRAAARVVRQMVSAAITIGANAGQRSATSTTGDESDAVTWTDSALLAVSFGGVRLTDEQREQLGLPVSVFGSVSAPEPPGWPEVSAWRR